MKLAWIFVILPLVAQCQEKQSSSVNSDGVLLSSHPKAVAAASRVRPALDRDLEEKGFALGNPIFIRAFKEEMIVEIFMSRADAGGKYEMFRTYQIAASSGTLGPKLREGDGQVPEGFYFTSQKQMNPDSRYNLSFNIGYPNAYDRFHQRTGSHIMIHGSNVSIGCLAMTDAKIDEIFTLADAALRNGQPLFRIHFFPFRMTEERLLQSAGDPNESFWRNLKEGYDFFETHRTPPDVSVKKGRYVFKPTAAAAE